MGNMEEEIGELNPFKLMNMKLHEGFIIKSDLDVMRVPGGWIYYNYHELGITGTFVPLTNYQGKCGLCEAFTG
jgi:hypothetical protein